MQQLFEVIDADIVYQKVVGSNICQSRNTLTCCGSQE